VLVGVCGVIIFAIIKERMAQKADAELDFVYSAMQIAKKTDKTVKLLEFLARQDQEMTVDTLRQCASSTFLRLQQCWQARDYGPMKALMMRDLFFDHCRQIQGMIRNHEIDIIEGVNVDRVDIVNVRYTIKANQREFTALITATAKDYYIDDRKKKRLRGDEAPAQFQEFWTFQRQDKAWLLREIEQAGESDVLKEDNFFEQFTDAGVDQIYGDAAGKEGPAGPRLEKEVGAKDTRIERMLNFLVQTDMIWNRQTMTSTTRRIFLEFMGAWESGDPATIPVADLFPELAADLKKQIDDRRAQGVAMEFRNLCVRKIELILVRNFENNAQDEFVARIRAHAQKVMRRHGAVIQQDEDVMTFEQYVTFGRLDKTWKLKELLSPEQAQGMVAQENLDQDSNVQQLQWYYQHKRAV
jgi:predicted lipid-binding transport protein (Tim44 family)